MILIWFIGIILVVIINQFTIWYLVSVIDRLYKKLEKVGGKK